MVHGARSFEKSVRFVLAHSVRQSYFSFALNYSQFNIQWGVEVTQTGLTMSLTGAARIDAWKAIDKWVTCSCSTATWGCLNTPKSKACSSEANWHNWTSIWFSQWYRLFPLYCKQLQLFCQNVGQENITSAVMMGFSSRHEKLFTLATFLS